MPRRHSRHRSRAPQQGVCGFDEEDFCRLMRALRRDPLSVLAHFKQQGIHYLSELDEWPLLCERQPETAQCIRDVAALYDLPEWPE